MDKITYKEIMYELPNDERKFNQGKVQQKCMNFSYNVIFRT